MSKSNSNLGKSLKGLSSNSALGASLEDSIINQISSGSIEMTNIQITGGIINSTIIGNDTAGPIYATTLQTGLPDGSGFDVWFYGDTLGEYVNWNSTMGILNIQGDLNVDGITDLGNFRLSGNTMTTTNTNGSINLDPNGLGNVNILSGLNVIGPSVDIQAGDINIVSGSGDISLSNSSPVGMNITAVGVGMAPTITTAIPHNLKAGDTLIFSGVNCLPGINEEYIVNTITSPTTFTILPGFTINSPGDTGTFLRIPEISLNGLVSIPLELTIGNSTNTISASGDQLIISSDKVVIDDPILTLVSDAATDRGVEFKYPGDKLGFFGMDETDGYFTYIPVATNNMEIISGALGNSKWNNGIFNSLQVSNFQVAQIDVCNIYCPGVMNITGLSGIRLNGPSTTIQNKINFQSGSEISAPLGYINLSPAAGGVKITENLPLILNTLETTKLTGDTAGNLIINSGNSINLVPSSGQVTLPAGKRTEYGSPQNYIGSDNSGNLQINSSANIGLTTFSGDITLSPNGTAKSVIIPKTKKLQFGDASEFIQANASGDLLTSSAGNANIQSTSGSINLLSDVAVSIPSNVPLTFGSVSENIKGTPGVLQLTSASTNLVGNLLVNGSTTTILSANVSITDPIITLGTQTFDAKDRGIEYKYNDKMGFFGRDDTDGYFMYIPDSTNNSEVISGALGNSKWNSGLFVDITTNQINSLTDLILNPQGSIKTSRPIVFRDTSSFYSDGVNLHVDVNTPGKFLIDTDTIVDGDLTVTGNINFSGSTTNLSVQRFTVNAPGSQNPNSSSNITFINVSGTGIANGVMSAGSIDGFLKNICISSAIPGTQYHLTFPTGLLVDPGSGTGVAKKIIFENAGQSIQMVWDNVAMVYIITQGGCEIIAL